MSKPIDYEFRFWFALGFMFIMLGCLLIELNRGNVFWSIWDFAFVMYDGLLAKINYDKWKLHRR
jgi:hypothetical protein